MQFWSFLKCLYSWPRYRSLSFQIISDWTFISGSYWSIPFRLQLCLSMRLSSSTSILLERIIEISAVCVSRTARKAYSRELTEIKMIGGNGRGRSTWDYKFISNRNPIVFSKKCLVLSHSFFTGRCVWPSLSQIISMPLSFFLEPLDQLENFFC